MGNDAVVALLETAPPPQDESDATPEPQDKPPPPAPKAPLTVGAAHARGRLLGRKLFRAVSNEDAAAAGRLLGAVERAPTLVRRAAIAFADGNRWTSLHAAAAVGNAGAVTRLLAVGASPCMRTATGADVVKIACDARQTEVAAYRGDTRPATGKAEAPGASTAPGDGGAQSSAARRPPRRRRGSSAHAAPPHRSPRLLS